MNQRPRDAFRWPAVLALAVLAPALVFAQSSRLPDDPYEALDSGRAASGTAHKIPGCVVGIVDKNKIDLPAPEAGILTYMGAERGSEVKAEEIIAEIDTREVKQAIIRAENELELAVKRAEDTTEIDYADISAIAEREDWIELKRANADLDGPYGAAPAADVRRQRLEFDRARMGAEKARKDQYLAGLEANVKRADLQLAQIKLEQRQIRAPFAGEVLRVYRNQGEWVQPGDPVAEIANLDTLQVDGYVEFDQYDPREIRNCRVTIDVEVGRGRVVQATGYIVYIDPIAESLDTRPKYQVSAEVSNRREGGAWVISPNLRATMTIHLGTGGKTAVGQRPSRGRAAK